MNNIFKNVMLSQVKTNRFDLSHDVKLSFRMGELVPTCVMECLPGDRFSINVENMLRFAPLVSPVMHKVNVTTHYFFVPTRILWPEWEKWIMGESDVQAPYLRPQPEDVSCVQGSLMDYLGYPTFDSGAINTNVKMSPLPISAYLKIWNEYYRDQNLQAEQNATVVPGTNMDVYEQWFTERPLRRAWMHDYFTACLPFAQKGDAVQLPLTASAQVPVKVNLPGTQKIRDASTGAPATSPSDLIASGAGSTLQTAADGDVLLDPNGSLYTDVQAEATDINTLRRAFRLQEWLERNARGGTRYVEGILAHFGIKSSDARLQRPEYIGGARQNMVISEVLATAQNTTDGVAVGTMAGHGISVGGGNTFNYSCEEHGYIIGIINVQPVTAYQQGLHRSLFRLDRLDYAWPTFANIGEQEVYENEVHIESGAPTNVFGYIPRYSEYKYMNSRVAGEFRSSLAFWHLGRIFAAPPVLNEDFIKCDPSTRIFAVTDEDEDHIYSHIFNNVSAVRKLPRFGIPTI